MSEDTSLFNKPYFFLEYFYFRIVVTNTNISFNILIRYMVFIAFDMIYN